jgi:hypothetical protein
MVSVLILGHKAKSANGAKSDVLGIMRLSEAAQASRKSRHTSGASDDKKQNGLKQVLFLFQTVSFFSHPMPCPTNHLQTY